MGLLSRKSAPGQGPGMLAALGQIGGLTAISRVLGFIRDILIAIFIGAGPLADAFFIAFKLPNLFRRLTAEGAMTNAFMPAYARAKKPEKMPPRLLLRMCRSPCSGRLC